MYCTILTTSSVMGHRWLWNEHMCKIVTVTGCHEHPTQEGVYFPKWVLMWLLHLPEQKLKPVWFSMCLNVILWPWGMILGLGCPVVSLEVTLNTYYSFIFEAWTTSGHEWKEIPSQLTPTDELMNLGVWSVMGCTPRTSAWNVTICLAKY
jgi:hypothetical protein